MAAKNSTPETPETTPTDLIDTKAGPVVTPAVETPETPAVTAVVQTTPVDRAPDAGDPLSPPPVVDTDTEMSYTVAHTPWTVPDHIAGNYEALRVERGLSWGELAGEFVKAGYSDLAAWASAHSDS